ncbi:MAG: Ku protein [Phycisphaerae bacterium]|jgi:DNA end-binding protein Ku
MSLRASWKGRIKVARLRFAVALYGATAAPSRLSFNQLHSGCGARLRQQMACPEHGPVERAEIAKGYEYEPKRYVVLDEADFESIAIETDKTIAIDQFVPSRSIDALRLDTPYYVTPDGPLAEEPYVLLREALRRSRAAGIGRVTLFGREHAVALAAHGPGMLLTTLRAGEELRSAEPYFAAIPATVTNKTGLGLALQLIAGRMAEAPDLDGFQDRYQDALLALIRRKIDGAPAAVVQHDDDEPALALHEALLASIGEQQPETSGNCERPKRAKRRN